MRRSRHLHVFMVAASAAALAMSGCGSDGSESRSVGGRATTTAPAAHGATAEPSAGGGAVGFTDVTDNDGPRSTVILTGAIGDFGQATSVHPDGTVDPDHGSQLGLTLRYGSFRVNIADLHRSFVTAMRRFPSNTRTCSGTVTVAADAPIVAGSGTGSYRGISGGFHLTIALAEVDATANCGSSSAFLRQSIVTAGSGTVSFR
jgi:hypothetical protein